MRMRIEFTNQWGDVMDFYRRYKVVNADLSIVWVNIEYSAGYTALYFFLMGFGVEIVLKEAETGY